MKNSKTEEQKERCEGLTRGPSIEEQIIATKQLRQELDAVIQNIRKEPHSRELTLALTKAQESLMWCGMNLKRLGNPNPYPNSRDTSNAVVDPTSEGLKI